MHPARSAQALGACSVNTASSLPYYKYKCMSGKQTLCSCAATPGAPGTSCSPYLINGKRVGTKGGDVYCGPVTEASLPTCTMTGSTVSPSPKVASLYSIYAMAAQLNKLWTPYAQGGGLARHCCEPQAAVHVRPQSPAHHCSSERLLHFDPGRLCSWLSLALYLEDGRCWTAPAHPCCLQPLPAYACLPPLMQYKCVENFLPVRPGAHWAVQFGPLCKNNEAYGGRVVKGDWEREVWNVLAGLELRGWHKVCLCHVRKGVCHTVRWPTSHPTSTSAAYMQACWRAGM